MRPPTMAIWMSSPCCWRPRLTNKEPPPAASHLGDLDVVCLLLGARAGKGRADTTGKNQLRVAYLNSHLDVVSLLHDGGADKAKADMNGLK